MGKDISDPYKVLFVFGSLFAVAGASLWTLFEWKLYPYYPKQAHAQIMFFGFMWSFVAGFLMTAIPRMTTSSYTKSYEMFIVLTLLSAQLLLNLTNFTSWGAIVFCLQNSFLLFFIIPRFLLKKKIPFDGFLFMPTAFLLSFIGLSFYAYQGIGSERALYLFCGEAFIVNLILGLGSRMIPALSRLPNSFMHPEISLPIRWWPIVPLVLLLNVGFFVDYFILQQAGQILRFVVVLYISVTSLGFFKKPLMFSWLGLGLKVGVFFLVLGHFLVALNFNYRVPGIHLIYIGGFSLITLMVATRVTLAHSQASLDYEIKSTRVLWIGLFVTLAAITRWFVGNSILGQGIQLSSFFFIMAVFIWLLKHTQLLLKSKQ